MENNNLHALIVAKELINNLDIGENTLDYNSGYIRALTDFVNKL